MSTKHYYKTKLEMYLSKLYSNTCSYKKIILKFISSNFGYGELILFLVGLIVIGWLHGGILFFWDTVFPFHPAASIYYYFFTWNQLISNGQAGAPNEWGSYFFIFYILYSLRLGLHVTQIILIYILFSFSGFSMYRLIKFLHNEHSSKFSIVAFSGAMLYMFNFYVLSFLLFDFYESWFVYAFLPLAIIVFLKGLKGYVLKESYFKYIFYLVILVEIMSVGFWEPPYLLWTLFIFFVLTIDYFIKHFNLHKNMLDLFKYLSIVLVIILITNLWWIYTFIWETMYVLNLLSFHGSGGGLTAYMILMNSYLNYPPNPFMKFLNILAFYPNVGPYNSYNGYFTWAPIYLKYIVFFVALSFIFIIAIFANLFENKIYRKEIIHHKTLYYSLLFLIFFALQGLNPANRVIIEILLRIHFEVNVLYSTNLQFIGFPLIFLYALSFSKTIAFLKRKSLDSSVNKNAFENNDKKRIKLKNIVKNKKNINIVIFTLIVIVVVIYPWYLWTPNAMPVLTTTNGKYINSTVNFPKYFYNMSDYINKNSHNAITLILPEYANFFTMNFNNSSFADTLYAGLITGSPAISNYYSNITIDIENMIYTYPFTGDSFANFLNAINVKYILLNTVPIFLPGNPGYNISYLKKFLLSQQSIELVYVSGPLELYENMMYNGILAIGNAIHYNESMNNSQNVISIFNKFSNLTYPNIVQCSYNFTNNSLILLYNKLRIPINPIYFTNANPLNINLTQYHYLVIKLKTSDNVNFLVGGDTYFSDGLYGSTLLQRMNLTSHTLINPPNSGIYYKSTKISTLVYPLYGQNIMPYSTLFNNINKTPPLLNYLGLGLSFTNNLTNNESGWIQIYNISLAKYISTEDMPFYLASSINSFNEIIAPYEYNTNNSNIKNISIQYTEVNPTQYKISVFNAKGSFILYLKQQYDPMWALYINGNILPNSYHFIGNIYNNAWYINKTGNYTIVIIYSPQILYNVIVYICIISLSFISIVFIFNFYNSKIKNKKCKK
ncbi:MAG: hypothetical protein ACP5RS_03075 [Thermoplasmata archaeon]